MAAIHDIWTMKMAPGSIRARDMAAMLRGTSRKIKHDYRDCALTFKEQPVTGDELRAWYAWWQTIRPNELGKSPDTHCCTPIQLQSSIMAYRNEPKRIAPVAMPDIPAQLLIED